MIRSVQTRRCLSRPEPASARTTSWPPSAQAAWAKSIRPTTRKLGRDVAIKVLPEALASDPERIARFEREAKTLAALNHPNIGHIYGVEKSGATRALVMELGHGPTMADSDGARPDAHR